MNRNKIRTIIAALSATIMLTGCGATTETKVPLEVVGTVPSVTITALETMPVMESKYEFGDIVYSLDHWPDGTVNVCRHAVVAHVDDIVMVTSAISDSAEALRKCLPEAMESWAEVPLGDCIEQIDADALYSSEKAAQDAADELMSGR
jgi:hypothetical protein